MQEIENGAKTVCMPEITYIYRERELWMSRAVEINCIIMGIQLTLQEGSQPTQKQGLLLGIFHSRQLHYRQKQAKTIGNIR